MLVLTRTRGEVIRIKCPDGKIIDITVIKAGNHVQLGFDADKDVNIIRKEIDRKKAI